MEKDKEKFLGESPLFSQPKKKVVLKLKPGSVGTDALQDGSITEDKLSQVVKDKLSRLMPTISLGFYTDDTPPTPVVLLSVRPSQINSTIVPYLLISQEDRSDLVTEWKWVRSSPYPSLDNIWNSLPKTSERTMYLSNDDFPPGWDISSVRTSFQCTATFEYEGIPEVIFNVITTI